MAHTRQPAQMPWWLQRVRQLQEQDGYVLPQQTPRMHAPASPVHSESSDGIDLTHTDGESESDWSTHSSDNDFIDDSDVDTYLQRQCHAETRPRTPSISTPRVSRGS
jgi:hypothetical protein